MQTPDDVGLSDLPLADEALRGLRARSHVSRDRALARAMDCLPSADLTARRAQRWGGLRQTAAFLACAAGIGIIVSAVLVDDSPFALKQSGQPLIQQPTTIAAATPDTARIRDDVYPSLAAAIAAADPNDTVLVSRSTISVGLRISKPMLLVNSGNDVAPPS